MNKKLLFIGFFIIFCMSVFAQKTARNAQVSLFSYDYTFSEDFMDKFKALSANFSINKKDPKLAAEAILARNVFEEIKSSLDKVYGLFVLPENSFLDAAKYDDNGYPQILIQKAIREGNTKFFFKISTRFDFVPLSELPERITAGEYPRVYICIKIYNKFGYEPIQVMEATYYTDKQFVFNADALNGLAYTTKEDAITPEGVMTFKQLIKECTYRAVNR